MLRAVGGIRATAAPWRPAAPRPGLSGLVGNPGLPASVLHGAGIPRGKIRLDTFPNEKPLAFWFLRMDNWPELAQYAIELLACPASSVLSERTFSAAGGFVTRSID